MDDELFGWMGDDPLLPMEDVLRWSRGSLPFDFEGRSAALLRRAAEFAAKLESLRDTDPELYDRLNTPM